MDRVQSNAGRGAVIGAVVLTSLATYWAVTTPRRQPNPYDPGFGRGPADYATLRATSVVIVMFSGAALGAAVGATMPRWHRILPR